MRAVLLAHEHAHNVGFWADYVGLLGDKAHWLFEVTTDLMFAGLGAIWVRFHDRKHHGEN